MAGKGKYTNTDNHFNPEALGDKDGYEDEGDSYTKESAFLNERNSPGAVGTLHQNSDVDSSQLSQHHTLGPRHNQSAPGDHSHDGVTSKNIGAWTVWAGAQTSWSSQGTQPSIGNGIIEGKYRKIGTDCIYRFALVAGSGTTFGTGAWEFLLPFTAVAPFAGASSGNIMAPAMGPCKGFQSGVANRTGVAFLFDTTHAMLVTDNNANVWQSNNPFTWAANSGNHFGFEIAYETLV